MADKKPDPKKAGSKPASSGGKMFELEAKVFMIVAFVVVIYLATGRYVLERLGYRQSDSVSYFYNVLNDGLGIFNGVFNTVIFVSVFSVLFFVLGSFYLKYKHKEIVTLYRTSLPKGYVASLSSTSKVVSGAVVGGSGSVDGVAFADGAVGVGSDVGSKIHLNNSGENKKWIDIEKHMASMNSSDWRMAILEADILLYEMLDQMGYEGDTIADKLKAIEPSDFNNLDSAWRAHKVRNTIAHEGASYEMSYEQAQNTIDLYRRVFEEFYFI
jgi:hypothetical protein